MMVFSGVGISQTRSDNPVPPPRIPDTADGKRHSELPHVPRGRSTVMGGEIRDVDLVRDQFTLKVFGGNAVKILFDERTRVYRDGKQISVLTMKPEDHASIETVLDGTSIFALRIHMLTKIPEAEFRGQVVSFDSLDRQVKLRSLSSRELLTLQVPEGVAPTGLVKGSIVDVNFRSGTQGFGVATKVDVVAVPGGSFTVNGNLSVLDVHAGRMVISNSGGAHTNEISFEPARFAITSELKEGAVLKVTATFDGVKLIATNIEVVQSDPQP